MTDAPEESVWAVRAERLLELALRELREPFDAIPTVTAALAALRIEAGELPESELDGYPFPGEPEDESRCICPPEMRARDDGSFKGGCPVHG